MSGEGDVQFDCEAYECLEEQLETKPTGRLANLLPDRVYQCLFGPRPPDAELVDAHRDQVYQAYCELITAYRPIRVGLTAGLDVESNDIVEDRKFVDHLDSTVVDECLNLPDTATDKRDRDDDLSTLTTAVDRTRTICDDVAQLLADEKQPFLREAEQEQLETIQAVLQAYTQALESKLETHVHQTCHQIITDYRAIRERLITGLTVESAAIIEDRKFITHLQPANLDECLYPDTATGEIDLDDYRRTLRMEMAQAEKIYTDIKSLVAATRQPFLQEADQQRLKAMLPVLTEYAQVSQTRREHVQATVELKHQLAAWQSQIQDVDEQMQSYLAYEQYAVDSEMATVLERIQDELAEAAQAADLTLLDADTAAEVRALRTRVEDYIEHLDEYQDEYVHRQFTPTKQRLEDGITQLQHDLTPAQTHGRPLKSEADLRTRITVLRDDLASLRTLPLQTHLDESQRQTLDTLEERLDDVEAYIDAKVAFDNRIDDVEAQVDELQRTAAPYLHYETYLTRPAATTLEQQSETAANAIAALRQAVDLDRLSTPDQERFAEAEQDFATVVDCLEGYNEEFIRQERERYADLFADIGAADLTLTAEQQRAVITNAIYNQVIAAAGTGKTLVLTTRVAYLIESQQIDPEQILVVTFTNEARDEMEARLAEHFDITNVQVETVHAFGNRLLQTATTESTDIIGTHQIFNLIDRVIRNAREGDDETFLSHYYEFLRHFETTYLDETDFETKEAYVEARADHRYQTLQGEEVKSRGEKCIADFLFTHQVDYRYEDLAPWADTAADKGPYEPDFYLPEYDLYIEHWGIDLAGEIAPWFTWSTEEYHFKMRWARDQLDDRDAELIETYSFEYNAGQLERSLRAHLEHYGVELDQMAFEELVETAFDYNRREGWIKRQFRNFIQNAKQFDVKPDAIEAALTPDNPRQYHFGQCAIRLLQEYQQFLVVNDLIDFSDMITQSVELIKEHPERYQSQYDHILVDEFQDIGIGMLELLQELTGPDAARLFAVGDDWQSIYSFQGAVVQYFLEFEDHFGTQTRTTLTENFRSPPEIVEAGNTLIENNDAQLAKDVQATVDRETTPRVHTLQGYTFYDYVHRVSRYTTTLIREYLARGATPDDIMVLCRFDGAVPYLDEIKAELREAEIPYTGKNDSYRGDNGAATDGVAVYSVYQAKGREANHVILVHAVEGPFGFPPTGRTDRLLQPVQPVKMNTIAEERRAFYVAITRTQQSLDVLTRQGQPSRFLEEIEEYTEAVDHAESIEPLDDVGSEMSVEAKVKRLFDDLHPKKHQDGILVDQYGGSARFVSWASTDPPTLEQGAWYRFDGVQVKEFNEQKELVVTRQSSITQLDRPPKPISDTRRQ